MPKPMLFYTSECLTHLTAGHPESPERLATIWQRLETQDILKHLQLQTPQPVKLKLLERIHQPAYLDSLERFAQTSGSGRRIDEDTVVSEGTYGAALAAAGAAVEMVEALVSDRCQQAFSLIRPPGHHAMPGYLMGFCFFNNIALAALYALEALGLQRIAILDWDAHHGNGTEHIFYRDPRVLTVSWHQAPNWPGTGAWQDQGEGPGWGYSLNVPLPQGSGYSAFERSWSQVVYPALQRFNPQMILVAAGYDAHHADGLTQMGMTATGFACLTELIMQGAEQLGIEKVGFVLEGGYHLEALANSVYATLATLLNQQAQPFAEHLGEPGEALGSIDQMILNLQAHPLLAKETQR